MRWRHIVSDFNLNIWMSIRWVKSFQRSFILLDYENMNTSTTQSLEQCNYLFKGVYKCFYIAVIYIKKMCAEIIPIIVQYEYSFFRNHEIHVSPDCSFYRVTFWRWVDTFLHRNESFTKRLYFLFWGMIEMVTIFTLFG